PDEGEADQGVAAEGPPVGAGGGREDIGQRGDGSRSAGGGIKEAKRGSGVVGRQAAGTNGGARGRTARQAEQWLWRERVRAEENRRDRSPRCAGQAVWWRFLATGADWRNGNAPFGGADGSRLATMRGTRSALPDRALIT